MSHLVKLVTQIKDREMLEKSLKEMGYNYTKDQQIREWNGTKHMVEVALSDRVGFKQKQDETFDFIGDMMYFKEKPAEFIKKVSQMYGYNKIKKHITGRYTVRRDYVTAEGERKLVLSKV